MPLFVSLEKFQFTRQQIGAQLNLSDELLAYWIKEGLLASRGGGEGKGRHRRFRYQELHIAALLAEMRRYGVNIAGLRGLSATIYEALATVEQLAPLTMRDVLDAATFHRARTRFASEAPEELERAYGFARFEDWLEDRQKGKAAFSERGVAFADAYTPLIRRQFAIHEDLFTNASFEKPTLWFLTPDEASGWDILTDGEYPPRDASEEPSYIAINISLILRRLWNAK